MNYNLKQLSNLYEEEKNKSQTARAYCKLHGIQYTDTVRRKISGVLESLDDVDVKELPVNEEEVKSDTSSNNYKQDKTFVLSAWNEQGHMMDIDEYCEHYTLPRKDISSYKLVSHTGTPFYNIVFKENVVDGEINEDNVREILENEINKVYEYKQPESSKNPEGVLKWADLHFGAYIKELLKTRDFNADILREGMMMSVNDFNSLSFSKRHVHIQGDLIESFSGLNHINSWQSMDSDMIGAIAVKMCSKLLHEALSNINNLGCVKITAGNHDRLSKNNDEDVKGGAAELIAYCLELMGYDVEFHPYVITHEVEGINYINLHGDKKLSSKSSEKIVVDYGTPGCYNLITEAHLHSMIEKMSASQIDKFKTVRDDGINMRRMHLKSFFTGNYYSETLGYVSNAGYSIIWANERGLPKILDNTI